MIEFELDGKTVKGNAGASILEVALQEGKYIPHFCYHKKLSIAANCRMCLVEVEKARGPVPACATPITEGMKVHTCSKLAVEAQKGVMEFLLINHPLDCPICDQGGECQLQDLAVGYGRSSSRFEEEKRAVVDKDLGPLVKTTMTRCIHCSRCVRFTDEIAGYQELGMSYRNNHVEVMPFIGKTVNSELSGNIIDICPVGALTSKPFRDTARSWELSRRKSVSPHDGLGSNIQVHIDKYHKVVRVLPLDNEAINECWISDRDRFSYEGLYHEDRITSPMIKQNNQWVKVDWETAITYAAKSINGVKLDHGADSIGVLASAISTTEELYLLQKLMRGVGTNNIDYRLNQQDFSADGLQLGAQYLGCDIKDLFSHKSLLIVGSVIREEQPILAAKIRHAVKNGMELHSINVIKDELLTKVKTQLTVHPREIANNLAQILKVLVTKTNQNTNFDLVEFKPSQENEQIANSLLTNQGYIVLGRVVVGLDNYATILSLVQEITRITQGGFGYLSSLANEVGAQVVGFTPYGLKTDKQNTKGKNIQQMFESNLRAYVLLNTELEHDAYSSQKALAALTKADTVIVLGAYVNPDMLQYADVILPVTPFTETAGSYVNMSGTWQKFNGVTKPYAESRPAWKVIRVLANNLAIDGFGYTDIEEVRKELAMLDNLSGYLDNKLTKLVTTGLAKVNATSLIRFGINPIYQSDSIVRRAYSLQNTALAKLPIVAVNASLANKIGASDKCDVTVVQSHARKTFQLAICNDIADNVVLFANNHETIGFAGDFDPISIELIKKA